MKKVLFIIGLILMCLFVGCTNIDEEIKCEENNCNNVYVDAYIIEEKEQNINDLENIEDVREFIYEYENGIYEPLFLNCSDISQEAFELISHKEIYYGIINYTCLKKKAYEKCIERHERLFYDDISDFDYATKRLNKCFSWKYDMDDLYRSAHDFDCFYNESVYEYQRFYCG